MLGAAAYRGLGLGGGVCLALLLGQRSLMEAAGALCCGCCSNDKALVVAFVLALLSGNINKCVMD